LIRRILERSADLPAGPQIADGDRRPRITNAGPIVDQVGPYVISGGWWVHPIHREYYFARAHRGDVLWIYYDRQRQRWFLQGAVE
jgi:protein ImuB